MHVDSSCFNGFTPSDEHQPFLKHDKGLERHSAFECDVVANSPNELSVQAGAEHVSCMQCRRHRSFCEFRVRVT
jgi:hypothetical protein